jgi:hypothetical protein
VSYSIDELIKCAEREVGMRKRVYPRWVEQGRMKEAKAAAEIAMMGAIVAELRKLAPGLL